MVENKIVENGATVVAEVENKVEQVATQVEEQAVATADKVEEVIAEAKSDSNLKYIASSLKKVNTEIKELVSFIAADVSDNGEKLRNNASLAIKDISFVDSVEKIKSSSAKINAQLKDATTTVTDSILKRSKQVAEDVQEEVEEMVEDTQNSLELKGSYGKVMNAVKGVNNYSIETAREMIDLAKTSGEEWSKLVGKAMDGGFEMGKKNQAAVFDALEVVKKQLTENTTRLVNIFKKEK